MEIPLAIIVLAAVFLYGVVFFVVGLKRGSATEQFTEEDAPILESRPQLIQKKVPTVVDGTMSHRATYSEDRRFGGNKVITLPFSAADVEDRKHAHLDRR